MKVQRQLSKKRGDKRYYRFTINIPEKIIKKVGFEKGQELEADTEEGKIILKKKHWN
jgi:bifunctional DNA-binding transcriptional regulator/antitoxin component of YhaV-PrlF toxin-antitoxin module